MGAFYLQKFKEVIKEDHRIQEFEWRKAQDNLQMHENSSKLINFVAKSF